MSIIDARVVCENTPRLSLLGADPESLLFQGWDLFVRANPSRVYTFYMMVDSTRRSGDTLRFKMRLCELDALLGTMDVGRWAVNATSDRSDLKIEWPVVYAGRGRENSYGVTAGVFSFHDFRSGPVEQIEFSLSAELNPGGQIASDEMVTSYFCEVWETIDMIMQSYECDDPHLVLTNFRDVVWDMGLIRESFGGR